MNQWNLRPRSLGSAITVVRLVISKTIVGHYMEDRIRDERSNRMLIADRISEPPVIRKEAGTLTKKRKLRTCAMKLSKWIMRLYCMQKR